MKLLLFTIAMLFYFQNRAQDENVFKRLHGVPVKKKLKVYYTENGFRYARDNDSDEVPSPLHGNVFNISNDQKNILFIMLQFYNPLNYKIEFSSKELEDPDLKELSDFISTFSGMPFPEIQTPATTTLSSLNKAQTPSGKNAPLSVDNLRQVHDFTASALMYDWIEAFNNTIDLVKINTDIDQFNEIVETINDIESVEKFLYREVVIQGESKSVLKWAKEQNDAMLDKNTFSTFESGLKRSKEVAKGLKEAQERALKAIEKINKLLTEEFAVLSPFLKTDVEKIKQFKVYSASKKYFLEYATTEAILKQATIIDKLNEFNEKLDKHIKEYKPDGFKLCFQHEFDWKYNKVKEITFIATGIGKVTSKDTATFTVAKDKGVAIFASTGAFYTPYEFKNYGLDNGMVSETNPTKIYGRPAAYLNLLFKRKKGDVFYWLAQIGISAGNDAPLIPIGVGVLFRNNFSVSTGGLIAWQNRLEGISLKEAADDAKLKNSIRKTVDIGWYISLNYKLSR